MNAACRRSTRFPIRLRSSPVLSPQAACVDSPGSRDTSWPSPSDGQIMRFFFTAPPDNSSTETRKINKRKKRSCCKRRLRRVCRRLRSAQNRMNPLFRPMLTFAYAGARFVSLRKGVSKPARDDVSCDNSRAERVGRILAASFTAVKIVYVLKRHIRPGGGDVSLCFACGAR